MKHPIQRFFLLVLMGLMLPSFALGQLDRYMDAGKKAYRAKKYNDAIEILEKVAKEYPKYAEVYVYLGLSHFERKEYLMAELDFFRALKYGHSHVPDGLVEKGKPYPRLSDEDAAKLHNNRGIALYELERYQEASDQFYKAMQLDRNFQIAQENYQRANQRARNGGATSASPTRGENGRFEGVFFDHRPQLPNAVYQNTRKPPGPEEVREQRIQRMVEQGLREPERRQRNQEFKRRSFFGYTPTYKNPTWAAATQPYVNITEVKIDQNSTFMTFRVSNNSTDVVDFCIADPSRDDVAFYLTDKSGSNQHHYELKSIVEKDDGEKNISTCGNLTQLNPGDNLRFTLEFERIPDDLRYVNVIEGNRTDGNQWDFYMVDLSTPAER